MMAQDLSAIDAAPKMLRALQVLPLMLAFASFPLAILAFYYASTPLRLFATALQVSVYAYMLLASQNSAIKIFSLLMLAISWSVGFFNALDTDLKSVIVPLSLVGGIGCSWYALEFKKTRLLLEFPFVAYLMLTAYLILVKRYGPAEFNEFYAGISRNGYSAILFSSACGYIISRDVRGKEPSVLLLGAAFACAFPLYGRASIAALGILLAAAWMRRNPLFACMLLATGGLILVLGFAELDSLAKLTNFKSGLESDRWQILHEYLVMINPRTLTTGVNFADVQSIRANGGSPDIAFLRLHSYLGIVTFMFVGAFIFSGFYLAKSHRSTLLIVLFAVIVRAFTDVILLFGTIDFFYMPVLFFTFFARYWRGPTHGDGESPGMVLRADLHPTANS